MVFVGGDPALSDELANKPDAVGGFARIFIPAAVAAHISRPRERAGPSDAWLVPADQVMCVERLVKAAEAAHRTVHLVDVNRPGDDRPLVERFVTPSDVLPIALRSDGVRLVGAEAFSPGQLRRFLSVG